MEDGMVNSAADLTATINDTDFSDAPAEPNEGIESAGDDITTEGAEESPEPVEGLDDTEETSEETEEQPEATEEDAPAAASAKKDAPLEDLPEGVRRGKDRNGKEGYWVEPHQWGSIYGSHKISREGAQILGEPLTQEALQLRQDAYLGQERLYTDLLSADPTAQAKVVDHILGEAQRALDEGEVGTDPMISFTERYYEALQKSGSEAYASLRRRAAYDLLDEMYQQAAEKGNKDLWYGAQHMDAQLGRKFRPVTEMDRLATGQTDRASLLEQENAKLREQLTGRSAQGQAQQFESWQSSVRQAVPKAVLDDAVMPALAEAAKQAYWAKNPDVFKDVAIDRLEKAVRSTIEQDQGFKTQVNLLTQQARAAVSPQIRQRIGKQIENLYVNRARIAVEAHKGDVLRKAAEIGKQRSDATHQRLQSAQQRRGPSPNGTAVPKPVTTPGASKPGGFFDPAAEARALAAMFR